LPTVCAETFPASGMPIPLFKVSWQRVDTEIRRSSNPISIAAFLDISRALIDFYDALVTSVAQLMSMLRSVDA
jgi:hypothetical protein